MFDQKYLNTVQVLAILFK